MGLTCCSLEKVWFYLLSMMYVFLRNCFSVVLGLNRYVDRSDLVPGLMLRSCVCLYCMAMLPLTEEEMEYLSRSMRPKLFRCDKVSSSLVPCKISTNLLSIRIATSFFVSTNAAGFDGPSHTVIV